MLNILKRLCQDNSNVVYLMSGRSRVELEPLLNIPNLGICAENGCFLKLADRNKWEFMLRDGNIAWRKKVMEIFEYYTE